MDGDGIICQSVDILPTEFAKEVTVDHPWLFKKVFFSSLRAWVNDWNNRITLMFIKASQHFGDILSQFVGTLASTSEISDLPPHLRRACIACDGSLTSLYEYIKRMRKSDSE